MIEEKNSEQQSLTHGLRTNRSTPAPRWVRMILIAGVIAVVALAGLLWWSQSQISKLRSDLNNQQNSTHVQEENKALVDKVGEIIILPDDENPTIATVNDLDKLKGQPFFAKAELGDKVLIYAKAKKAILYRPGNNKIIELAPLSDNGDLRTTTNAAPPTNTP